MRKIYLSIVLMFLVFFIASCNKKITVKLNINGEETLVELSKGGKLDASNNPTIDGFDFEGWYKDSEYSEEFSLDTKIDKDITLYAKLSKYYNVTIVVNGESKVIKVQPETLIKDLDQPELEEQQFVGWYSDSEFKQFVKVTQVIDSDITLYGKYMAKVYTVTFDTKGGNSIKAVKFSSGTAPEMPVIIPTILGYEFEYWSLDEEGKQEYDFKTPMNEDFKLYANYKEVSYDDLLDSIVPDEITEDIELPDGKDSLEYEWKISNPSYLTYDGIYNPDSQDREVTVKLTLNVKGSDETITFEKKVTVKKYELKPLVTGDVVIGYTSSWYYNGYTEEVLQTVDVLNISFAYVFEDATLNLNGIGSMLVETTAAAHRNGVRVCLSVQGYGEDTKNFSNSAANPTTRTKLVNSMVDAVVKYRLDGIDIDWEYPGSYSGRPLSEDKVNYTLFIKELRQKLDSIDSSYLLTSAIPAGPWGHSRFELEKLHQYFDFINMMSYDLENGSVGSHHSALLPSTAPYGTTEGCSVEETLALWTGRGVPKSKICLGIAFYGKDIYISGNYKNGLGQSAVNGQKYSNKAYDEIIEKYISKVGDVVNYGFDDSAKAPYMFNTQTKKFLTYENELSALYKCQYAKEQGLGGVMIWEIGEDDTSTLITAVAQGYGRHIEGKTYLVGGNATFGVNAEIDVHTVKEIRDSILGDKVVFKTSDESIASINGSKVLFKKAGTVTITATNADGSQVYGVMTVQVK